MHEKQQRYLILILVFRAIKLGCSEFVGYSRRLINHLASSFLFYCQYHMDECFM